MSISSYTFDPLLREYLEKHGSLTAEKMAEIAKMGRLPGCAPVGYLNTKTSSGAHAIMVDDKTAPLIREGFELAAEGNLSIARILEGLTARGLLSRGGRVVSASGLWVILNNPFYCGKIRFHFTVLQGTHEPVVSEELFDRVQKALDGRRRNRG